MSLYYGTVKITFKVDSESEEEVKQSIISKLNTIISDKEDTIVDVTVIPHYEDD